MNRDKIKQAYDAMTPDEAARQRMLKRIMNQGGQKMHKEYTAQPQKSRGWLGTAAAILVLAVLVAGVVTMLGREAPDQLDSDRTSETTESTAEAKKETIQDFKISLFYWTAMEYVDWIHSDAVPNQWQKQAEIAEHFGMKAYTGDDRGTDSYDFFLAEVGLASFLREDVEGAEWEIESCWYYDQERFNVAGSVTMGWEDSPRTVPVDFNFYRTAPDYLFPVLSEMGPLENYESWEYTLSTGETVILARNQETAYVIVYRTEEVYFVVVNNWKREEEDRTMTPEALEAFAELFFYTMAGNTEHDSIQQTELSEAYKEVLLEYHRAYQEGWSEEQVQNAGRSLLIFWEPNLYQLGYQLMDIDGNGILDMVISNDRWIFEIITQTEGGVQQIAAGHPTMMINLCTECVIEVQLSFDEGAKRYDFYRFSDGKLILLESIMYDPDRNGETDWFQVDVGNTDNLEPMTKDEYGMVLASYQTMELQLQPIEDIS